MLDFYLLTGEQWRMLLLKSTPIFFRSEVPGVAGICKEHPGVQAALHRAKWQGPPVLAFGDRLTPPHGARRRQPHGLTRGHSSPWPGPASLSRGTVLQPLTSFQRDQAQTSVPGGDCARAPQRTDTLCNATTGFAEGSGTSLPPATQHHQDRPEVVEMARVGQRDWCKSAQKVF